MDTSSFEQRYCLTKLLEDNLQDLFCLDDIELIPYGIEKISNGNKVLDDFIKLPAASMSHAAMMIKFAPDFILIKKTSPIKLYFIEVKTTVTPLCSPVLIEQIRNKYGQNIQISDIGIIAREAWNAYKTLFFDTIIVTACSYNPRILLAQFVDKIQCLRCYDSNGAYDCTKCPIVKKEFFDYSRNIRSSGSQTPQTNINYSSFMDFEQFFSNIGIRCSNENIKKIKNAIKEIGVNIPDFIYEKTKKEVKSDLFKEGCVWI